MAATQMIEPSLAGSKKCAFEAGLEAELRLGSGESRMQYQVFRQCLALCGQGQPLSGDPWMHFLMKKKWRLFEILSYLPTIL